MNVIRQWLAKGATLFFSLFMVLSAAITAQAEEDYAAVLEPLKKIRPDFNFDSIEPTRAPGIYKAAIERGPIIYLTEDGKYFFAGDFFEVGEEGLINIAEVELESERRELLSKISDDDMITFSPEKGKTRAIIYVFTDADCYYCQKLHSEMDALNEHGIEVRYLAYPRAGVGSPSYRKIASAWCDKDPNDALTRIKAGETIPDNVCDPNPVADQYQLGGRLGVTGTPALVTEDGKLYPGYKPADKLAEALGL